MPFYKEHKKYFFNHTHHIVILIFDTFFKTSKYTVIIYKDFTKIEKNINGRYATT